ncbi:MAG: hypothetical protein IPM53_21750 [Anaerolineaceae bacterium]|nr:hypothetical protein [Anaerolineaceae bacterium]
MFNLPDYPDVYTTRHITCVSCKEKFAITEGNQDGELKERKWRVLSHWASQISLRHEDNRQQRPVVPQPRQVPVLMENTTEPGFLSQPPVKFTPYDVHCPRCGADNRNWIALQNTRVKTILQIYKERFPQVFWAILIAGLFAVLAATTLAVPIHWLKVTAMVVFIPLSVWGLAVEHTSKWNELREGRHIARVKANAPDVERTLWIRGFAWVTLASFAVPLLFFSLLPRAALFALEVVEITPEEEVKEVSANVGELVNQNLDSTAANLESIANEMDELLSDMPTDASPQFEEEVATFSDKLSQIASAALRELNVVRQESAPLIEEQRTQELGRIETAREQALNEFTEGILGDFRFLLLWSILMGLPLFFSVFFIMRAIKEFVKKVDQQLPPPIFHSVAGMTRIVGWEAKQALEIEGTMHHIQWVNVERNAEGGINLTGLHRDPPNFDSQGRAVGETVRAQKHLVETDMWGRIIRATIHDTRVQRPAGGPEFVAPLPMFHDAPVAVRPPNR